MRLIFLKLDVDFCGDTNELGNIGGNPWKSYLFFLTTYDHEIGLSRDMVKR